jgi:hypothetical protein
VREYARRYGRGEKEERESGRSEKGKQGVKK